MANGNDLPKLRVTDVLIDVDDTITFSLNRRCAGIGFLHRLVALIVEREGISSSEALAKISQIADYETTCIFSFLEPLGVPFDAYWQRVQTWLGNCLGMYDDAREIIRSLPGRGIKLYSATTNSRMVTLAKLAVYGLATSEGSQYFNGFFGGDAFGDPNGKFSPNFFPSILETARLDPATTLMIGDDPRYDLAPALAAGIRQVVLPRRSQDEAFVTEADGGIYVRSLELVLDMIEA